MRAESVTETLRENKNFNEVNISTRTQLSIQPRSLMMEQFFWFYSANAGVFTNE